MKRGEKIGIGILLGLTAVAGAISIGAAVANVAVVMGWWVP